MLPRLVLYSYDKNLAPSLKFEKQQVCTMNKVIVSGTLPTPSVQGVIQLRFLFLRYSFQFQPIKCCRSPALVQSEDGNPSLNK